MEKTRDYKFDNLKCLLIFLVVYAHCSEWIFGDLPRIINILIYIFHMPAFIFISGYFSKFKKEKVFRLIGLYMVWQIIYRAFENNVLNLNYSLNFIKPDWLLWYLFSLILWTASLKVLDTNNKKIAIIIFIALTICSLLSGYYSKIGTKFSLSRTIVFFPYFILGYYLKKFKSKLFLVNSKSKKDIIKIIFSILILIIGLIYFAYELKTLDKRPLLGRYTYKKANYDMFFRLIHLIIATNIIFILLNIIPNKEIHLITKVGQNTLWIYLLHGLWVLYEQHKIHIYKYSIYGNICIAVVISIIMLILFGYILPTLIAKIKNIKKTE